MHLITRRILSILLLTLSASPVCGQLVAGFTATPAAGCPPLVVAFTNTTTPSAGTTYVWDLDNGTGPIYLTDPGTSYLTSGTYTVTLTATNGSLSSTHTQIITVYPEPLIHFTASDTLICPGAPDNFTTTTVGGVPGPVTYLWSFGDGYTSTSSSYTHTYSFPGHFNITLTATNADGCDSSLTLPAYVHVRTPPVPVFSASATHICDPPVNAVFSSAPVGYGPFGYHWTFGDGSAPSALSGPIHSYTAFGAYAVGLIVTDIHGCEDSSTIPGYITVSNLIAAFTGPDSVCINLPVTFTNTSSPYLSCQWIYGDGTTDTSATGHHTYHAGGSDTVKLVTYNGFCYDTAKHPLFVQAPVPTFTFTPAHPCPAPATTLFAATVIPGSTVLWHFGDSTTGSGINISHTYYNDKVDTIQMFTTTSIGCRDTVTQYDTIHDFSFSIYHPIPMVTSGCVPLTVHFLITSPGTTVPIIPYYPFPITSFSWNFGDGSPISTTVSPVHIYTATGIYHVVLTVVTANGCTEYATDSISAGTKPSVTFTATPLHVCAHGNQIDFTATVISGSVQYWDWKFGEGVYNTDLYDTSNFATHHFLIPGVFSDTVIGYNYGCPDTFIRHNYVTIDSPNASVYPHVLCSPVNTVQFADSSKGDDTRIWIFGDGSTSTLRNPVHTYTAPVVYNVAFHDYNIASGCHDTSTFTLDLTKPVVTIGTPDSNICRDGYVIINSSVISGYANYYDWFAAGISGDYNNFNFIDTFHATGMYTIQLVVHDQNLCSDTITRTNYIHVAKPVAHFTVSPSSICLPLGSTFSDGSTDLTGTTLTNFKWTFGDSTIASSGAPSLIHNYTATGSYSVTEIVTDNIGCKDTLAFAPVSVYHPWTLFTANDTAICPFNTVSFTSTSSPVVAWYWTFGDGYSSASANPTHAYLDTGTYTVRLVVTDVHGCHDTVTHLNYIKVTKPFASFFMSDSVAICPPFAVHFTNTSTGGLLNKWSFGNGDSSVAPNPTILYTSPGYDLVRLIVTNPTGCKDTAISHMKVFGYAGAFTYSVDSGCFPLTVLFNADLSSLATVSSVIWDFSDGITSPPSVSDTITHTYLVPGAYVPKLIISDSGCTNSSLGIDTIKVDGIRPGFTASPNPVCIGDTLILADTSASYWSHITARNWACNGASGTLDTVKVLFTTTGTDTVTLHVTDNWGCTATTAKTVSVYSIPGITVIPDSIICVGAKIYLNDSTPGGLWSSSNTGIATIGTTGIATGIGAGTAIITYRLTSGCLATRPVTVNAYPDPGIISGNAGVCLGATATLTETVAGGTWSAGNGNAAITPSGLLTGVAAGTVTISYTVANFTCDSTATKIITVYPLPDSGTITGQSPVCKGATITLAESIANGKWSSSNTAAAGIDSNTGIVTAIAPGTTIITYTTAPDANGCINSTDFTLTVINADFTISANIIQVKCYNDSDGSISITVNGGAPPFQYLWSTGSAEPSVTSLDTGVYMLSIKEPATQCTLNDTFLITQPDSLLITAEVKEDICRKSVGSIITAVSGGTPPYSYLWPDKGTGNSITNIPIGTYALLLTDFNGCRKKMSFDVPDTCNHILIHDGISPNGDGINDTWVIEGIQLYPENTVQVFDKWGDEVFSKTNYNNDWGATGKNGLLPDGTYYYLVKLNSNNTPDGKENFTGSLLIKR